MNPSFQPHPGHSNRVFDPILIVHDEFLRNDVNHLSIHGHGYGAGGIDHSLHIIRADLSIFYGNHSVTVNPSDVSTCNPRIDRGEVVACHQLRFFNRLFDRMDSAFDIDDHPFS
jgi:hypothetical protein